MDHEKRLETNYKQILNEIKSGGKWQRITIFEGITNAPHLYLVKCKTYTDYAWIDPDKAQSERLWPFDPYTEQIVGILFLRRATLLKNLKNEIRWEKQRRETPEKPDQSPRAERRLKNFRDNIKEINTLLSFIQKQAEHIHLSRKATIRTHSLLP